MMKMRTRNPAASADIGSVIQSPTARHRYIAMQVAKNPPNDAASCPRLRAKIGATRLKLARLNAVRSKTGVQVGAIFEVRALLTPPLAAERMVRLSSNGFSCRNACLNENAPT